MRFPLIILLAGSGLAVAQVLDVQPPAPSPVPASQQNANADGQNAASATSGTDVPFFDSGREIVVWDGKSWNMHINKARKAAAARDKGTVEAEIKAAVEIWPRNPALEEAMSKIHE